MLETAEEDLTAFYAFQREHWTKIRSTNPLERLNKQIGRRSDVVGIFPNDQAVIRPPARCSWNRTTNGSCNAATSPPNRWRSSSPNPPSRPSRPRRSPRYTTTSDLTRLGPADLDWTEIRIRAGRELTPQRLSVSERHPEPRLVAPLRPRVRAGDDVPGIDRQGRRARRVESSRTDRLRSRFEHVRRGLIHWSSASWTASARTVGGSVVSRFSRLTARRRV
jgi:Transposase, Mutator family